MDNLNNYFEQADNRDRLKNILLFFGIILCPIFAFLFKISGAPTIYVYVTFSATFIFPLLIYIDKKIDSIKGKIQVLYFIYFTVLTLIMIENIRSHNFETGYYSFFTGFFSLFIFSLQRFWYAFFYFIICIGYLFITVLITDFPDPLIWPRLSLFFTIGFCSLVVFYSRNKLINSIQDYNSYLKTIVNNPVNGFVLFDIKQEKFEVIDSNNESFTLFHVNSKEELVQVIQKLWTLKERRRIESLAMKDSYQSRIDNWNKNQLLDVRVTPIWFKTGKLFIATVLDVTQQVKEQQERSKEILRAEIAEENNKLLEVEIKERKEAQIKLQREILRTKSIFESSSETLLLTLDLNFKSVLYNTHFKKYFESQTEVEFEKQIDFIAFSTAVFNPLHNRYIRLLLHSIKIGKSKQIEISFQNKKGHIIWLEIFLNPIFNDLNEVHEISLVIHDITEKKENEKSLLVSLKEKEVLLKEVHHRVKNNLQVISSILNLQSSFVSDDKILNVLTESRNRVRSMAIIHENLYKRSNFSSIDFTKYLKELAHNLHHSYHYDDNIHVSLNFALEELELSLDQAIPCGLIVNEILSNSLKYAFKGRTAGNLFLDMKVVDNQVQIEVADDGVGFEKGFNYLDSDTLGIQLILTLIEQLDGEVRIENEDGLKYFLIFDKQKIEKDVKN